jgi:hypothetical protein
MDIQKSESIQKTQIREKDGTASVAMYTPSSTKTMSRIKKKKQKQTNQTAEMVTTYRIATSTNW